MRKQPLKQSKPPLWVAVVLDESGSMSDNTSQTIAGFNEFLQDRKKDAQENPVRLWLTKFNTTFTKMYTGEPVAAVQPLTSYTYKPDGMTALYDAIGATVRSMEKELAASDENPRLLVLIMTDGGENSSREITLQGVKSMIKTCEDSERWVFTYIGANVNAQYEAETLGTRRKGYSTTNATYGMAMAGASTMARSMSSGKLGQTANSMANTFQESVMSLNITTADALANVTIDGDGNIVAPTTAASATKKKPKGK